jgi:uncharacterized protein YndB with AHSA1/START domain
MLVHSDRRHRFGVPRSELWDTITQVDRYPTWWPWLRSFDATDLKPGAEWQCRVQPPLPYSIRLIITIEDVVAEQSVAATVSGDVEGTAELRLLDIPDGSEAHLTSALAPSSRPLKLIARAALPVVRFGHDWVLDTGAKQFSDRAL